MKGFSQLDAPFTYLMKKGGFRLTEDSQRAFDKLKEVMSTCLVLALPDFIQPFVLECYALGIGIRPVLMKKIHLIAFKSRKHRDPERLYSIYDKEILTTMHTMEKFWQYLVGSRLMVRMGNNNLKYFLEQKDLNERQQKWVTTVHAYDFDIEYVKGNKNVVSDALSRKPGACLLMDVS